MPLYTRPGELNLWVIRAYHHRLGSRLKLYFLYQRFAHTIELHGTPGINPIIYIHARRRNPPPRSMSADTHTCTPTRETNIMAIFIRQGWSLVQIFTGVGDTKVGTKTRELGMELRRVGRRKWGSHTSLFGGWSGR